MFGSLGCSGKKGFTALFTKPLASWFLAIHDLTGTIPLFHHSKAEAVNGETASGGGSNWWLFWE